MLTTVIILLIIFGIVLLLLEFLVVPGVTVAGIGGIILLIAGIVLAYNTHGRFWGHITLIASIIFAIVSIMMALKSKTWDKIMLKSEINSNVNQAQNESPVQKGDRGLTVSRLAPMGKILINGQYLEAKAMNTFIDQETDIEVIKINNNQLIVKPCKNE